MMNFYRVLMAVSLIFVFVICIGSISASDMDENSFNLSLDDNATSSSLNMCLNEEYDDILSSSQIHVAPDEENPNQMVKPTIQPAIDAASSGDTIVLEGDFAHCKLVVNKSLNIVTSDSSLWPCPLYQSEGAGSLGVFYITDDGSGSSFNGIVFKNNARAETPFSFLIRGASDITISNCSISYDEEDDYKFQGIIIENSKNIKLSNLIINNTLYGIRIINSSNIDITDCIISNNLNQAISVVGDSRNINIKRNTIENNAKAGLSLKRADNIVIANNLIKNNGLEDKESGSGIYVNTNITKLVVKGNVFIRNGLHAILYDYRCRNLNNKEGADLLTDVDNNYFQEHSAMILHHRIYVERAYGDLKYDAENDVFGSVGEGNYIESNTFVYMKHAFIYMDVPCGYTYYTTKIQWALTSLSNNGKYDLSLKLSLKEIKNGVYRVAIVDSNGNVAKDFNSIYIPVFLNNYSTVTPQKDDICINVLMKNGVGTADFRSVYPSFKATGNVITAVFPGLSNIVANNYFVQLKINDNKIPINPSTKLTASKLTTYPLSGKYLSVKLKNSKGKPIPGQKITFKFNGKKYTAKTNANGIAKVKVSLTSKKTYSVSLNYAGSDDYKASKTTTKIIVKTGSKKSKITASNIKVKKNKKKTFQLKLTNSAKKALKGQKILVKVNGKSYTIKTNSKGIAKLSIKLSKVKKYKISMKFLGNAKYKAASRTNTITVTKW